jgi:hypothetical protein
MCKYKMETLGIYGYFEKRIRDFNMDLIPLSADLMSLEYPLGVTELFYSDQYFSLNLVAESIQRIQIIYGKIPTIWCKGDSAFKVIGMMRRMQGEYSKKLQIEDSNCEIDELILLDRTVDP